MLTIGCWPFYHCLYLQSQDTLEQKNDGLATITEGLYYYHNMGGNSEVDDRMGRVEREIPEPMEPYNENIKIEKIYI